MEELQKIYNRDYKLEKILVDGWDKGGDNTK